MTQTTTLPSVDAKHSRANAAKQAGADWIGAVGTAIWCILAASFAIAVAERVGLVPGAVKQWLGYHYLPILAGLGYVLFARNGSKTKTVEHGHADRGQLLLRGKLIAATVISVAALPGQGVFEVTYRFAPSSATQEVCTSTLIDAHLVKLKQLTAGSTIAVIFDPGMPELHAANLGTAI